MVMAPQILDGNVTHKRLFPKTNSFTYGIYYLAFPLSGMGLLNDGRLFGVNRAGLSSFHEKDHGARDSSSNEAWARAILAEAAPAATGDIILVTMPRIFGYVFNPVSFWLCHDDKNVLRAVICEVNNTFGERHSYICSNDDGAPITAEDTMEAQKMFHVSPFLKREGSYKFRFNITADLINIRIDYYDAEDRKQLITALTGRLLPYTRKNHLRALLTHPACCLLAVARIHLQAVKLVTRGIKYISKPMQADKNISFTKKPTGTEDAE
jgi:DUF1365 family protein